MYICCPLLDYGATFDAGLTGVSVADGSPPCSATVSPFRHGTSSCCSGCSSTSPGVSSYNKKVSYNEAIRLLYLKKSEFTFSRIE